MSIENDIVIIKGSIVELRQRLDRIEHKAGVDLRRKIRIENNFGPDPRPEPFPSAIREI